ncbi:hypothetical protein ma29 [Moumouvirus australiensis]|uniref:DUF5894 domain-containing protein n=1 Tax=Moumouvirus australiensis TaxID=2109587 RepID=A0A2P1EKK6_9VIRU|nr:hypothetical protein QKC55_gp874 [Moumouvirus australiensis]AVL94416.1 hypothetical protein ma29 [Moumouvirus australiensis]
MLEILNTHRPKDGYVLIVNAKSGRERKGYYMWAEENGYKHCNFKTEMFDKTIMHRQNCGDRGCDFNCPGEWCYYEECSHDLGPWDSDQEFANVYNAVIIGKELPKLSKSETRKKRKYFFIKKNDNNIITQMKERNFGMVKLSEFKSTVVINNVIHSKH